MKIVVEWMDGVTREWADASAKSGEGVLKIWKEIYYGKTDLVAEIPLTNVREWKGEAS